MQTYLFYDTETTGLNESFDQILHFAAIRTDLQLKELARYELKIKLNPDVIPAPRAMITHRMNFDDLQNGISEYQAAQQIHQWVNEPGTISLGYNTLEFDDEFLRFLFFRNLLPVYTHQFKNNCSRMDLYPMAIMYYLFKNTNINWPEKNNKISFKLEDLNAANQFVSGRSHHAMIDVEVTLALARQMQKQPEMWQHVANYFNKQADEKQVQPLQQNMVLMVYSKLGFDKRYQSPVVFIGQRLHYKQLLWLQLDNETLTQTTEENINTIKYIYTKKLGEPPFILPARFLEQLNPDRLFLAKENQQWLQHHTDLFQKIKKFQTEYRHPLYPNTDVSASLYLNGFWTVEEEHWCRAFHAANPKEKAALTEKINNVRLKTLAVRILGRHFRECLTHSQAEQFETYLKQETIFDYQNNPRLTVQSALEDIIECRKQLIIDTEQLAILDKLELFLNQTKEN